MGDKKTTQLFFHQSSLWELTQTWILKPNLQQPKGRNWTQLVLIQTWRTPSLMRTRIFNRSWNKMRWILRRNLRSLWGSIWMTTPSKRSSITTTSSQRRTKNRFLKVPKRCTWAARSRKSSCQRIWPIISPRSIMSKGSIPLIKMSLGSRSSIFPSPRPRRSQRRLLRQRRGLSLRKTWTPLSTTSKTMTSTQSMLAKKISIPTHTTLGLVKMRVILTIPSLNWTKRSQKSCRKQRRPRKFKKS